MLVLHLDVDLVNNAAVGKGDAVRILVNDIPSTFLAVCRDAAVGNILENALMEVANVIIVGFVTLAKDFVANRFFPGSRDIRFCRRSAYGVDDVAIEPLQIK